jgi:hypothetical protein
MFWKHTLEDAVHVPKLVVEPERPVDLVRA